MYEYNCIVATIAAIVIARERKFHLGYQLATKLRIYKIGSSWNVVAFAMYSFSVNKNITTLQEIFVCISGVVK